MAKRDCVLSYGTSTTRHFVLAPSLRVVLLPQTSSPIHVQHTIWLGWLGCGARAVSAVATRVHRSVLNLCCGSWHGGPSGAFLRLASIAAMAASVSELVSQ